MKERFGQFGGLIKGHVGGVEERLSTRMDLQGFWDMVLCQVGGWWFFFGVFFGAG